MKWLYTLILAAPLLSGCIGKGSSVTLPVLGPVDRIEAKTLKWNAKGGVGNHWLEVEKTITNPAQIAKIVALVDAQRNQFRDTSSMVRTDSATIEFALYFKGAKVREVNASPGSYGDEWGAKWNMAAFDYSSSPAYWLKALAPDDQVAAFGPFAAPKATPKAAAKVAPKAANGKSK